MRYLLYPIILLGLLIPGTATGKQTANNVPVPTEIETYGIPAGPFKLEQKIENYFQADASSSFVSWHPRERSMIISRRAGKVHQLFSLDSPGEKPVKLTNEPEPVTSGLLLNTPGCDTLFFSSDKGGNECFQFYCRNLEKKENSLLTDGSSRHTGWNISSDGKWVAYSSFERNNRDGDLYMTSLDGSGEKRLLLKNDTPDWSILDWSRDDATLLVSHRISKDHTELYLYTIADGELRKITRDEPLLSIRRAELGENTKAVYLAAPSPQGFVSLYRLDTQKGTLTAIVESTEWDLESFRLSPDERTLAYVVNEDGYSKLYLRDLEKGTNQHIELPGDIVSNLSWHNKLRELAFTCNGYQFPNNVYSLHADTLEITVWTASEPPPGATFIKPEVVHIKAFDGLRISNLVYYPDKEKFPGPRPSIVIFHGGPAGQSRPSYKDTMNYYVDQLGIALVYPNIRGSLGYGKVFLDSDNGMLRENAFKDAGAVFEWIRNNADFDPSRMAVMGGSYGGFMTLSTLYRYPDWICCGVDSVGMSNLVTFLNNTSDYRRDNRREEYGDERITEMHEYLERTAPNNNVDKIKAPLFIIQGQNDPRVPASEAEAIRDTLVEKGNTVWYLNALDEGHGFKKQVNRKYQMYATLLFYRHYLLGE